MILRERAVCAAMNRDVKDGGYVVFGMQIDSEDWIGIKGYNGWLVMAAAEVMPRKVLALIVEHAGGIPKTGQAWKLEKPKKGDIQRQDVMESIVTDEVQELLEADWTQKLARMPLTLEGYGLWQDRENLRVKLVAPELEDLAEWGGKAQFNGHWMATDGMVSRCYVMREPDSVTHETWLKHLSQMSWV